MLNLVDLNNIENAFKLGLQTDKVNIMPIMNQWVENKADLFKLFGDKLTIEVPIVIDYDDDYIETLVSDFCDENFCKTTYEMRNILHNVISSKEIKINKISRENDDYFKQKYDSKIYNTDMKVSKFLSKICPEKDKQYFDIQFSQLINNLKIKGILCLSIDPIDYLTMSVNLSNWSSCHKIFGDFRGGILSYMTDKTTVICYIKCKENVEYGLNGYLTKADKSCKYKFIANNKKWRMCAYVDVTNQQAILSRQYPFQSDKIADKVKDILINQFNNVFNINNDWEILNGVHSVKKRYKSIKYPLHYNDVTLYDYYNEYILIQHKNNIYNKDNKILVGNNPICPKCGKHINYKRHRSLMCRKCGEKYD